MTKLCIVLPVLALCWSPFALCVGGAPFRCISLDQLGFTPGHDPGGLGPRWSRGSGSRAVLFDVVRGVILYDNMVVRVPGELRSCSGRPCLAPSAAEFVEDVLALPARSGLNHRCEVTPPYRLGGRGRGSVTRQPGHGGVDPGTGYAGLQEKTIVLAIARELAEVLEAEGLEVFLTRQEDYALGLGQRAGIARALGAELLLSIHVNWGQRKEANGSETFFLDPQASDDEARLLASLENGASEFREEVPQLQWILSDLRRERQQQLSMVLADLVQDQVATALLRENRGVKHAPFYLLYSADVPAVLVELGFLSNEEDRRLLTHERERFVGALGRAVLAYKQQLRREGGSNDAQ